MNTLTHLSHVVLLISLLAAGIYGAADPPRAQAAGPVVPSASGPAWMSATVSKLEREFLATLPEATQARGRRGLRQVAAFWRTPDGEAAAFETFVRENLARDPDTLADLFQRFEHNLEQLDGHLQEIQREFRSPLDLDRGPLQPFDQVFAGYNPAAHISEDFFQNKLAFVVLLNFPLTSLEERLQDGTGWSRQQWAEARLAQRFAKRIPAEVQLALAQTEAAVERYIAEYNLWMHHLIDAGGRRAFPAGLRLLSHWNLRDEIKARYSDGPAGQDRQRIIQQVMERIVTQTIPAVVINNPDVDWNPFSNEVRLSPVNDRDPALARTGPVPQEPDHRPEPDTRYAMLLRAFQAVRQVDPYSPTTPTLIARRFEEDREIPEVRAQAMLEQVLTSPLMKRVGRLIEQRLGRPLEPFDLWYDGFLPRQTFAESELNALVARKYPSAEAFQHDMPSLLQRLGFSPERAEYLSERIVIEPSRGSGHAMGAAMRSAQARLRTRVEKSGMNYKGYNIALHELGHNVEQVFSLHRLDHSLLQGVPNNAFTEALAFVFQARDLEVLGLAKPDAASLAWRTLNDFWMTGEIAGVGLVDMAVWHWMYDHPQATPSELKAATLSIARQVWNRFFAPVFPQRDVVLLAVYSHMINNFLYLPDYPIGHLIAAQIEQQVEKEGNLGTAFERMATLGRLTPDLWMQRATGAPVGPDALLMATEKALDQVQPSSR